MKASTANSSGGIGCRVVLWSRMASVRLMRPAPPAWERFETAEYFGRVVEENFVDNIGFKRCPVHFAAGFDDGGKGSGVRRAGR